MRRQISRCRCVTSSLAPAPIHFRRASCTPPSLSEPAPTAPGTHAGAGRRARAAAAAATANGYRAATSPHRCGSGLMLLGRCEAPPALHACAGEGPILDQGGAREGEGPTRLSRHISTEGRTSYDVHETRSVRMGVNGHGNGIPGRHARRGADRTAKHALEDRELPSLINRLDMIHISFCFPSFTAAGSPSEK